MFLCDESTKQQSHSTNFRGRSSPISDVCYTPDRSKTSIPYECCVWGGPKTSANVCTLRPKNQLLSYFSVFNVQGLKPKTVQSKVPYQSLGSTQK